MGGGYIETFAFGGREPSQQSANGLTEVTKPNYALSLASAVAISSDPVLYSQRWYWPVLPDGQQQEPVNFQFADGGCLENSGMMALLARQVKRIITVVSTTTTLDDAMDFCDAGSRDDWEEVFSTGKHVSDTISSWFGFNRTTVKYSYTRNQVFNKSDCLPLLCKLQALKKAGKPAVVSETLRVMDNEWWGIVGGFDVKFVVVPIELSTEFTSKLPDDTRKALQNTSMRSDFKRYPHFSTFENWDPIQLKRPLSNILAATSEYFVLENKDLFTELLQ